MMEVNNSIVWMDGGNEINGTEYPVYIKDNKTGKCCGIHHSRFCKPGDEETEITFGLEGTQPIPEMAVPSDDVSIGPGPLVLMPIVNGIGEYTLHLSAKEKEKVLMDGCGVIIMNYFYQLYNGDTFQVGESTFTVCFKCFKATTG